MRDITLRIYQSVIFVIAVAVSAGHALISFETYALTVDKLQNFFCKVLPLIDLFQIVENIYILLR